MPDETPIIPALLAGAAVYFGITQQGSALADLAKTAVGRMVDHETPKSQRVHPAPKAKQRRKNKQRRQA